MATFWRSKFGRALSIWIITALAFELSVSRIVEVLGKGMALLWLGVLVVAPLALTVWALARVTDRTGTWSAVGAVVVTWIAVLMAAFPLHRASVQLNFWSHRAAYDAVVADMKAGRLEQGSGRRHGVKYDAPWMTGNDVGFAWFWEYDIGEGVMYDEEACPRRPTPPLPPPPPPPPRTLGDPEPPTIKSAGGNGFHLGGHYCYFSMP